MTNYPGNRVLKMEKKNEKRNREKIAIGDVWDKNKNSLMSEERLSDIARNPDIIKGTDSFDTINYWIKKYREGNIEREDYLARDKTGQLYDGYHRLIAAKNTGKKYVFVKDFNTEEEFLDEQKY